MKRYILAFLCLLFLQCSAIHLPKAENGILDLTPLSEQELNAMDNLGINGEWEFYPDVIVPSSGIFHPEEHPKQIVKVPEPWNSYYKKDQVGFGYGTYRLVVRLAESESLLYFKLLPQTSAYRFYADGNLLAEVGTPGTDEESTFPMYKVLFTQYEPANREIELLLTISNFSHTRGGFRKPIFMGTKEQIQDSSFLQSIEEIFICGAIISMGLYQFTIFLVRRKNVSSFYFSLFCFVTVLRLVILDNHYIMYVIPDFSWFLMHRIDYITPFFMVAFFLTYIRSIFQKGDVPQWLIYLVWFISFTNLVYVCISSVALFTSTNDYNSLILLMFIISIFVVTSRIVLLKRRDGLILFFATFALLAGAVHDLLAGNGYILGNQLLPFVLFFFFLAQSILLSKRNAALHNSLEQLTHEIESLHKDLESKNLAYSRFVPFHFLSSFEKPKLLDVKLGDYTLKKMTILSSDIRDFTSISENLSAEQNFLFINRYLSKMGPIIRENSGYIEKYIGDAIIAFFDQKPENAIHAAILMQHEIEAWNSDIDELKNFHVNIGVGLHYGELMMAVIGEENRNQSSVLSDGVMIANHLESLTKKYGAKVLISLDALFETKNPDIYPHRLVDFIHVNSKNRKLGVVEILVGGTELDKKMKWKEKFEEGVNLFWDSSYVEAEKLWAEIHKAVPTDKAATLYYERSTSFSKDGPPPGWIGF